MVEYEVISFVTEQNGSEDVGPIPNFVTDDDGLAMAIWESRMKNTVLGAEKPIWQHEVRKRQMIKGRMEVKTVLMGIGNHREY